MLTSWVHGDSLKIEKNPHYWDPDAVKLNAINDGDINPHPNARNNLFSDNNIAIAGLTAENLPSAL
jgi:ABC-type oligopeptide transport system substrate-binding subunit